MHCARHFIPGFPDSTRYPHPPACIPYTPHSLYFVPFHPSLWFVQLDVTPRIYARLLVDYIAWTDRTVSDTLPPLRYITLNACTVPTQQAPFGGFTYGAHPTTCLRHHYRRHPHGPRAVRVKPSSSPPGSFLPPHICRYPHFRFYPCRSNRACPLRCISRTLLYLRVVRAITRCPATPGPFSSGVVGFTAGFRTPHSEHCYQRISNALPHGHTIVCA